jgi:RimJ/RimL family protein N-acetyltransferase
MHEHDGRVPRLETARLILDAHWPEDLEPLAAMWCDPVVVAAIGGKPSARQDSWFRLLRYRGLWPVFGFGYWAVRDKASGAYLGDVGFGDFHREGARAIEGLPEAGWALVPAVHGRGLASEAVGAALRWLDARPGLGSAVCLIARRNEISIRLATRQGFGDPVVVGGDSETLLFTRPLRGNVP